MRDALVSCKACREIEQTCLRPSSSFVDLVVDGHGEQSVHERVAHTLATNQSRIDEAFYAHCVAQLEHGEQEMAELTVVVALAAGLWMYYLATGEPLPELGEPSSDPPSGHAVADYCDDLSQHADAGFAPRARRYIEGSVVEQALSSRLRSFSTTAIMPLAHCSMSPFDFPAYDVHAEAAYVGLTQSSFSMPAGRVLSRGQAESIAAATAGTLGCSF